MEVIFNKDKKINNGGKKIKSILDKSKLRIYLTFSNTFK